MKKNTPITTNQALSLKLEVGDKLNLFCNSGIYKTKITTEDNTEIIMPSKNYFFAENKLYIPYNNYITDEYIQIPSEYRYIKVDKNKYATDSTSIEESYRLLICDENGEGYHFNYDRFYIPLENIVEKPKEINLQELYNIQEKNGNFPLFKIVPENQQHTDKSITCAMVLDSYNNKEIGKLSPQSLQYKHYSNEKYETFILSYSDISKYKINNTGSINTYNDTRDIIMQKEQEDNPIFLVIQNGKYSFTDTKYNDNLVEDYKTAIKVLHDHFKIDEQPDNSLNIDMDKQFVFKITKSNLLRQDDKNFVSIILEGKEIPLIPTDKNTDLFFDCCTCFQYCNNVQEVSRDEAPFSGFIKDFASAAHKKLDSNNIHLSIKVDENNQVKTYIVDNKENIILDLTNTTLTQHLSTILPLEHHQNTESLQQLSHGHGIQDSHILSPDKNNAIPQQDSQNHKHEHVTNNNSTLDLDKNSTILQHDSPNHEHVTSKLTKNTDNIHSLPSKEQKPHHNAQDSRTSDLDTNHTIPQQDSPNHEHAISKLAQDKYNTVHPTQDTNIIYFPLPRETINIGDHIDNDKQHISFSMTYQEMLDFYSTIQKNYSHDYVINAYENIIKNYGKILENNDTYIDKHDHVFINGHDFGLLQ